MKMSGKSAVIFAICAVLLAGGIYYFIRPEPPVPEQAQTPAVSGEPALLEGNKLVEKKNGKLVWELTAKTIELDKLSGKVTLVEVQGTFYRDDGTQLHITAQNGDFDSKTHDFSLQNNVVGTATDGARLTADNVKWRQKEELITAKGNVKLSKPDVVATADEAQTDKGMENIRLTGNAVIVKGGDQL